MRGLHLAIAVVALVAGVLHAQKKSSRVDAAANPPPPREASVASPTSAARTR